MPFDSDRQRRAAFAKMKGGSQSSVCPVITSSNSSLVRVFRESSDAEIVGDLRRIKRQDKNPPRTVVPTREFLGRAGVRALRAEAARRGLKP